MFATADTIVAVATPPGRGGLGVVRLSGPDAVRVAGELVTREGAPRPRHATFTRLRVPANADVPGVGDHLVEIFFPAPASYTGEDVVELSAHGSPIVLESILRAAVRAGARLAEPGEFTLRAFLNGKIDLVQAEAVADLVDAVTPLQARAAFDQLEGTLTGAIAAIERELFDLMARLEASLDFPEEGYHFITPAEGAAGVALIRTRVAGLLAQAGRGRLVREGAQVVIAGTPNVGKSSLFNALLSANRAIVTDVPGTTRDLLTERANLGGLSVALVDTAGMRHAADPVEREGVERARGALGVADLVLVLIDGSRAVADEDRRLLAMTRGSRRLVVVSKRDLPRAWPSDTLGADGEGAVEVSASTGAGLDGLVAAIAARLGAGQGWRDTPMVTNLRHVTLLESSARALARAEDALSSSAGVVSEEFVLADLQEAAASLQEIVGRRTAEDVLRAIFERFCVGK
ncbi:MAG: tRNA uridine-5-carboxymethylaminomethyl(34) synthesis GTPase MnmE [Acidobacteriota bacterium]